MTHAVTHHLTHWLGRYPRVGLAVGLAMAVAFSMTGVLFWNELQALPAQPETIAPSQVADRIAGGKSVWVEIKPVIWDCANILRYRSDGYARMKVVFTDETQSVLGVAEFGDADRLVCQDFGSSATGIADALEPAFYQGLPEGEFDLTNYQAATTRVRLCTYCGRHNSTLGVIFSFLMVLLGLGMYPLCLVMQRNQR
jgi:hypothetical protein